MSDIHVAIGRWHDGDGEGLPLHEYLGMTWAEYAAWAETGELLEGSPYADNKINLMSSQNSASQKGKTS